MMQAIMHFMMRVVTEHKQGKNGFSSVILLCGMSLVLLCSCNGYGRVQGLESGTVWQKLGNGASIVVMDMEAIKMIESGGDPHAYNDGAVGLYQVTRICVDDFMQFAPERCWDINSTDYQCWDFTIDSMYSPNHNFTVANWYMNTRIPYLLNALGHKDTVTNRLISYNCGVGCVGKKLPRETRRYIKKYRRLTN